MSRNPAKGPHGRGVDSRRELHGLNAHRRLMLAASIVGVTALLLPASLPLAMRLAAAWDAGVLVFLALTWWVVRRSEPEKMQETVLSHDQGRVGILALALLATMASISAIFFILSGAKEQGGPPLAPVALAVFTIVCSWVLTHVLFALHYAHRFYRDDPGTEEMDATGGLAFPGDVAPHYWDFVYFSFVIGMTSQVSDVKVTLPAMRHLVLWHSVLSFGFYTVVLALGINITAQLL